MAMADGTWGREAVDETKAETRKKMREKITNLFEEVGNHYRGLGIVLELHQEHDVQAFYHLWTRESEDYRGTLRTIHIQGYPGFSSENTTHLWARLMDFEKIIAIRKESRISIIGNEHEAVIQHFSNFEPDGNYGIEIPYDAKVLEDMLAENLPELREKK